MEKMEEITLGCCGITMLLPKTFLDQRRENGEVFYCPNGHGRVFRETTASHLQKELNETKEKLQSLKTGQCPWCHKTRKNLSDHIRRRHA